MVARWLRWMALGKRLDTAIERGRRLHPWRGQATQLVALRSEVDELAREVYGGPCDAWVRQQRIRAEALDVAVVALRIAEGR